MLLVDGELQQEYEISEINTEDEELNSFLFTLGCYPQERITIISKNSSGFVVAIKDGRYSIDSELAQVITVK
ncbi:MAG: ferrous iron transport protein A [Eubacteriales bacterium]